MRRNKFRIVLAMLALLAVVGVALNNARTPEGMPYTVLQPLLPAAANADQYVCYDYSICITGQVACQSWQYTHCIINLTRGTCSSASGALCFP